MKLEGSGGEGAFEAGVGGFLQWPQIQGECGTFTGWEPSQAARSRLGYPPAIPSQGTPSDTPPSSGFPQPDTRRGPSPQLPTWWSTEQRDAVERPQGGSGMEMGGPASKT